MKKLVVFFLHVFVFGCLSANAEPQRPNVILFLVDDMGLMDTSVPMLAVRTVNQNVIRLMIGIELRTWNA